MSSCPLQRSLGRIKYGTHCWSVRIKISVRLKKKKECGVEGWGDVEGEVWSLLGGLLRSGRGEVSVVCFVHNSTYTLIRQKCLTVCDSGSRYCGEQRLLALLVRDLI